MKLIKIPKKKNSLRAIDQGTIYDITGQLRRTTRELERDIDGKVCDVVMIVARKNHGQRGMSIDTYHWGTGDKARAHWMLSTAKNRIEPA